MTTRKNKNTRSAILKKEDAERLNKLATLLEAHFERILSNDKDADKTLLAAEFNRVIDVFERLNNEASPSHETPLPVSDADCDTMARFLARKKEGEVTDEIV